MIPKFMTGKQETFKVLTKGLILIAFCFVTVFSFFCVAAIIISKVDFSYSILVPVTTAIMSISAFLDSFLISRKLKENGFVIGVIIASIIVVIMLLYSFSLGQFRVSAMLLTKLVCVYLSGILGGIIGVNIN